MNKINLLVEALRLLLHNWLRIVLWCLGVGVLSIVYIVAIPRSYKSEIIMLPEIPGESGGGGGLASMAKNFGVKLGSGTSEDAIYPEFYPKVVGTPNFLCSLLDEKVLPRDVETPITLLDYLTHHQKSAWWSNLLPSKSEGETLGTINPTRLTKQQERLLKGLRASITSFVDKRTNMVTIDVMMQDPEVAAQVATLVEKKLQLYIIDYRTSKVRNDVEYMEKITAEALADYKEAQQRYARFADANQELVLASVRQEEERLENEMQLAYDAYSSSAQQLQNARAKVQERTPAFTILQPASVPLLPSAPKRMIFVAMMVILTFLAVSVWIIGRDVYVRSMLAAEKPLTTTPEA